LEEILVMGLCLLRYIFHSNFTFSLLLYPSSYILLQVVAAYFPNLVELHNYPAANSLKQKIYNHETLNARVLKKFGFTIPRSVIEDIVNCKPGVVEAVLNTLQLKMAKYREKKSNEIQNVPQSTPPNNIINNGVPSNDGNLIQRDNAMQFKNVYSNQDFPSQDKDSKSTGKGNNNYNNIASAAGVSEEILFEKEQQIRELQETVEILELKIAKLEQLVRLKDNKIQKLLSK